MPKNSLPQKARHLRLVPPLPPGPEPQIDVVDPALWAQALPALSPDPARPGLRWAVLGLLGLGALWIFAAGRPPVPLRLGGPARPGGARAAAPGPSFEAYARGPARGLAHHADGLALGRPLAEGDALFADDQVVLGIHNAPAPGVEAAQFAAVFAMDQERHVAALYPAGAEAAVMPLPQVASMALLDGPQLTGPQGPVTLVAVFLRKQIPMGALMEALAQSAPAGGPPGALGEAQALDGALVRLQSVTLAHRAEAAADR